MNPYLHSDAESDVSSETARDPPRETAREGAKALSWDQIGTDCACMVIALGLLGFSVFAVHAILTIL